MLEIGGDSIYFVSRIFSKDESKSLDVFSEKEINITFKYLGPSCFNQNVC